MDPGPWNPSLRSGPQNPLSPQDPPPPAWWSKKDHHFGGVRCKVVGEWGGSAHQPDPTAQSVPAQSKDDAPPASGRGRVARDGIGGQAGPFPQPTESPAPSGVVGWQVPTGREWERIVRPTHGRWYLRLRRLRLRRCALPPVQSAKRARFPLSRPWTSVTGITTIAIAPSVVMVNTPFAVSHTGEPVTAFLSTLND